MMVCCRRATSHIHRPTSAALLMMDCCAAVPRRAPSSIAFLPSYHHRPSSSSRPLSSNNNGDGVLTLVLRHSSTATRRNDDDMSAGNREQRASTTHRRSRLRRETLKCGRARRKWKSKQKRSKEEESSSYDELHDKDDGKNEEDHDSVKKTENVKNDENDEYIPTFMRPQPTGNPIRERYIRSQRKIKFPPSIEGWKTVLKRAVNTYLWTFEGVFIKEKKRDERGNILPDIDDKEEEQNSSVEASKKKEEAELIDTNNNSLQDKATDAAGTIVDNVQKNISTMKEHTPKLIEMGKEMTGVSNKEELREWVSDQLRLGTACLTEFMRGYRKGRDEEMDRILHEYFKELDEVKSNESDAATTIAAVDSKNDGDDNFLPNEEDGVAQRQYRKKEKRPWGRNERRKIKALANKISTNR